MQIFKPSRFRPGRPWESVSLLDLGEYGVRLHWTDRAYRWHVNTGDELFVVLDGEVEMHHGTEGQEQIHRLVPGDCALIASGERHVARPLGEARILVIERHDTE